MIYKLNKKLNFFFFILLDLLRIFGGIIFLNSLFSWWYTKSLYWNYDGRLLNIKYLFFLGFKRIENFTTQRLLLYNGQNPKLPIYISINGEIFDVSASRSIYGPKGKYNIFSGKDCSRLFVTGCFQIPEECTYDLRGLDQKKVDYYLTEWTNFYKKNKKYWKVGNLIKDTLNDTILKPCESLNFF